MNRRKQVLRCLWKSLLTILLFYQAAARESSGILSFRELDSMIQSKLSFGFNTAIHRRKLVFFENVGCGEYSSLLPIDNNSTIVKFR